MSSLLAPEIEAQFRARLKAARAELALYDQPCSVPDDAACLKGAHAGMARLLAEALRECAHVAGCVKEENLLALGFTREEIALYGDQARGRAAMAATRIVRRAA